MLFTQRSQYLKKEVRTEKGKVAREQVRFMVKEHSSSTTRNMPP